jgi:hypothetical protein
MKRTTIALLAVVGSLHSTRAEPIYLVCVGHSHDWNESTPQDTTVTITLDPKTKRFTWSVDPQTQLAHPCADDGWKDPGICTFVKQEDTRYRFWIQYYLALDPAERPTGNATETSGTIDRATGELFAQGLGANAKKFTWRLTCRPLRL